MTYTYDAWGKPVQTGGTLANTLGKLNPFRYRGYVFDEETGLYYLWSRYYSSESCRFLNADSSVSTNIGIIGTNVFSYCDNSPVTLNDSMGKRPVIGIDPNSETISERILSLRIMRQYPQNRKKTLI